MAHHTNTGRIQIQSHGPLTIVPYAKHGYWAGDRRGHIRFHRALETDQLRLGRRVTLCGTLRIIGFKAEVISG